MSTIKKLQQSEKGIASLIITLVLMIVISLLVLGFAQITRREQRNSLDRQLSTQAFYAAESGVNSVKKLLETMPAGNIVAKKSCQTSGNATENAVYGSLIYSVAPNVSFPCILVSSRVSQLVKQAPTPDTDWVIPIVPVDSAGVPSTNLHNLTISWTPAPGIPSPQSFPDCSITNPTIAARQCGYSVLRVELVPTDSAVDLTRSALAANDMVSFVYPSASGSGVSPYSGGAHVGDANCSSTLCTMTISNLTQAQYYLRIHNLYRGTSLTVTGDSGIYFAGAQVQVDSTGKAQDVLRRIQVSFELNSADNYPQDAITSRDSLCKRFATAPNYFQGGLGLDTTNNYCGLGTTSLPPPPPTSSPTPTPPGGLAVVSGSIPCSPAGTPTCPAVDMSVWHFNISLYNRSPNASSSTVQSCDWQWDDNIITADATTACYNGDHISHVVDNGPAIYTTYPPQYKCRQYNIVLTIHFTNGAVSKTKYPVYRPFGGIPKC